MKQVKHSPQRPRTAAYQSIALVRTERIRVKPRNATPGLNTSVDLERQFSRDILQQVESFKSQRDHTLILCLVAIIVTLIFSSVLILKSTDSFNQLNKLYTESCTDRDIYYEQLRVEKQRTARLANQLDAALSELQEYKDYYDRSVSDSD